MRSYERNGVTVDQCTECRGLFLDRGELEHLIDAESRFNGAAAGTARAPAGTARTPRRRRRPTRLSLPPTRLSLPPTRPASRATRRPRARSPMADLSTIASMATDYLGKGKSKGRVREEGKEVVHRRAVRVKRPVELFRRPVRPTPPHGPGRDSVGRIMSLICPNCQGKMRSVENDGVIVDVCKQCRGVFLDRGELERLMAAESQFFGLTPTESEPAPLIVDYDRPQRPVKEPAGTRPMNPGATTTRCDRTSCAPKKKRKKTFLVEFFD